MRYVILRDDDTNALTPVDCLERLYRPFLDRGLPVNLAVIPDVAADATTPDGRPEGFFLAKNNGTANGAAHSATLPIGSNPALVDYLRNNRGYRIVQHGCHHQYFEFDRRLADDVSQRLDHGIKKLVEAGFPRPVAFVAPHDKFSKTSLRIAAKKFRVISTGWFEWRRLPIAWWPEYLTKKVRRAPHWRVGRTTLLSHPGCRLSCHRDFNTALSDIARDIESRRLTVLVTHWWEYFRGGSGDDKFIALLHEVADYLAKARNIRVVSFADVADGTFKPW